MSSWVESFFGARDAGVAVSAKDIVFVNPPKTCLLTFELTSSNVTKDRDRVNPAYAARMTRETRNKAAQTALTWMRSQGIPTELVHGVGACNGKKIKRPGRTVERATAPVFTKAGLVIRGWFPNEKSDLLNIDVKAILDGLVEARIFRDDNVTIIPSATFEYMGVDPAHPRVEIHIYRKP